jgi:hypothetical protein
MAIKYASAAWDPATLPFPQMSARDSQGHVKELCSVQPVAVGDTAAQQYVFGRVRSDAKLCLDSALFNAAITGLTSFDLGLFVETAPMVFDADQGDADCLIAAYDIHTAGSKDVSALLRDKANKDAWEIAGLTSDPGGWLLVVGTVHAAGGTATAAGNLTAQVRFRTL